MNKRIYKGYRYAANLILQTDNDQDAIDCLVAAGYSDERIARHTDTLINITETTPKVLYLWGGSRLSLILAK